ncbi:MAG: hypothetical protein Q9166_002457 [cf. Caloplaca sp. 2 TL-2023]
MADRLQKERPSRLKPPCIDPLDRVGLVSKGDKSLLDYKIQENYFHIITTRYYVLAGTSKSRDQDDNNIATKLSSLSLDQSGAWSPEGTPWAGHTIASNQGMSTIIMAMRKLREAIVASSRVDQFAKTVYLFIIRTTILLGHPESYHPALLYLFRCIQSARPLSKEEKNEVVGYYILDLACRQNDIATAFRVRHEYDYRSKKINLIVTTLVHGNWIIFQETKSISNVYEKCLMEWANGKMTDQAIRCLGKSYLSVNKEYLERCTGMKWERLREVKKVVWELDGETVMIKPTKKK